VAGPAAGEFQTARQRKVDTMTVQQYEISEPARRDFARLTAIAWSDDALRARYQADPHAVLAEFGISLDGAEPPFMPPPADCDIDLESLEVSAGAALATIGTVSCPSSPLRDR
jgi:hypothetical protein